MSLERNFSVVASVEDKNNLQGSTAALLQRLTSVASSSQGGSKEVSSYLIEELAAKLLNTTKESAGKSIETIPHGMSKTKASSKSGAGRGQAPPNLSTVTTRGNAQGDWSGGRGVLSCRK
jgi:hypothetical protein